MSTAPLPLASGRGRSERSPPTAVSRRGELPILLYCAIHWWNAGAGCRSDHWASCRDKSAACRAKSTASVDDIKDMIFEWPHKNALVRTSRTCQKIFDASFWRAMMRWRSCKVRGTTFHTIHWVDCARRRCCGADYRNPTAGRVVVILREQAA
jgi:hypothetical protein